MFFFVWKIFWYDIDKKKLSNVYTGNKGGGSILSEAGIIAVSFAALGLSFATVVVAVVVLSIFVRYTS